MSWGSRLTAVPPADPGQVGTGMKDLFPQLLDVSPAYDQLPLSSRNAAAEENGCIAIVTQRATCRRRGEGDSRDGLGIMSGSSNCGWVPLRDSGPGAQLCTGLPAGPHASMQVCALTTTWVTSGRFCMEQICNRASRSRAGSGQGRESGAGSGDDL
ncbi:unnamed protein product [Rangifer tarandus platyrhynchus]|uniref:Uncharacterized protein n=1 Tax=Rangifer tarandus platyrhynchus TaxID=3082113 RepID=A0AC59ZF73_RANTA